MSLETFKKDMSKIEDEADINDVKKIALALLYGCASYYQQYIDKTFPLEAARRELKIGGIGNESDDPDDYEFADEEKAAK